MADDDNEVESAIPPAADDGLSRSDWMIALSRRREHVLAELRCAALRARIVAADIDSIGVALKDKAIDPETAMAWAEEVCALDWLIPTPRLQYLRAPQVRMKRDKSEIKVKEKEGPTHNAMPERRQ